MQAQKPPRGKLESVVIACGIIGLSFAIAIGLALHYKLAFDRMIIQAHERMEKLGGGVTNGRRSAEGDVHVWSHDSAFDAGKLKSAMTILSELDRHEDVVAIYMDFRDSGVRDADMELIQGLQKLKFVDVSRTAVTYQGVESLLKFYPTIKINTNDFGARTYK